METPKATRNEQCAFHVLLVSCLPDSSRPTTQLVLTPDEKPVDGNVVDDTWYHVKSNHSMKL